MEGVLQAPDTLSGPRRKWSAVSARMRVELCYLWGHGRRPDLRKAARFTEKVQLRKLHDRDPRHPALMDKLAAKAMAARTLGPEWTIETLWSGETLPGPGALAAPAIVKARHGCNQYEVFRDPPSPGQWAALGRRSKRWMATAYGGWLDEWAYRDVPRGILAEPLITGTGPLPVDYKIYVFGGHATHVQVHLGRGARHRWLLHDRTFTPLVPGAERTSAPGSLTAMLDAAETLAKGQDFLRVDFYEVEGRPLFGEFCLYPGSGLDPFAEDWIDFELGRLWNLAARPSANPEFH